MTTKTQVLHFTATQPFNNYCYDGYNKYKHNSTVFIY